MTDITASVSQNEELDKICAEHWNDKDYNAQVSVIARTLQNVGLGTRVKEYPDRITIYTIVNTDSRDRHWISISKKLDSNWKLSAIEGIVNTLMLGRTPPITKPTYRIGIYYTDNDSSHILGTVDTITGVIGIVCPKVRFVP